MPGQPITRAAVARLEAYGLQRILDRIIDGDLLREIAADKRVNVSRPMLSRWLNGDVGDEKHPPEERDRLRAERRALYRKARALSSETLAEDGLAALDRETDPRAAQLVRGRAEFRLKLASVYDRARFGEDKGTRVNVTVQTLGEQHLEALRRRRVEAKVAEPALPSGEPDVEVADGQ
jgi:hypothetical protein